MEHIKQLLWGLLEELDFDLTNNKEASKLCDIYTSHIENKIKQLGYEKKEISLYGIFSPNEDLCAIHGTETGAEKNMESYIKQHGKGFYVDHVVLHD